MVIQSSGIFNDHDSIYLVHLIDFNLFLSETMYDVGIKNIVNIDLVESLIQQMAIKNKNRTTMKWLKMDMLKVNFALAF